MYGKYTLKKQGITVWSMTYYDTFLMLHSHALSNGFQWYSASILNGID